ncbi:placenta growth factor isoform X2 [Nannospalax galili]|uniref:placenta growth factor isoform X2 n=1 Tax=Nannospalax galili TaxID=1026970 RepID=UPI0004ED655E|nr:placenta growth factor isoform X2 [Nannospalax galili]
MVIVPWRSLLRTSEKMLTMKLFTCFLQVLAGLALPAENPQQGDLSAGNSTTEAKVVPFNEVWGRSYCRPMEKMIDIVDEYPSEVGHIFSPSCVSLLRCTGCCGDESLHCVPLKTANITMQVVKIPNIVAQHSYVELTFSQHELCECRPIQEKTMPEKKKAGRGKRKKEKQEATEDEATPVR